MSLQMPEGLALDDLMAASGAWNGALVTLITSNHSRKRLDKKPKASRKFIADIRQAREMPRPKMTCIEEMG